MRSISEKKRIVIKLGTSTLAHKTGKLNIRRMNNLVRVIADLHNSGREIILVSSGAMGLGSGKLGMKEKPKDTPTKQAVAAIGQCELMHIYDDMFEKYSVTVKVNAERTLKILLNVCFHSAVYRLSMKTTQLPLMSLSLKSERMIHLRQ